MGKLTTELVNQRLAPRGIKLVGEWRGAMELNVFTCERNHFWQAIGKDPVNQGFGCPCCRKGEASLSEEDVLDALLFTASLKREVPPGDKFNERVGSGRNVKLSSEAVKGRLKLQGIELVDEWLGGRAKHTFRCDQGHSWEAMGSNVLFRTGCPECFESRKRPFGNERLSPHLDVSAMLLSHGKGVTLIGKWQSGNKKSLFACVCGNQWEAFGTNVIYRGTGCPKCYPKIRDKLTLEEIATRLSPQGLQLVGDWNGIAKDNTFRCQLGHQWTVIGVGPLQGSGCPECFRLRTKHRYASF